MSARQASICSPAGGLGGVEVGVVGAVVEVEQGADGVAVRAREGAEDEGALGRVVAAVVEPVRGEARALRLAKRGELVVAHA